MKKAGACIILFITVMAALAMFVIGEAPDQTGNIRASGNPCEGEGSPGHCIPPDYFKDTKPATPLPESEMITIIISQKSFDRFSADDAPGILTIPVSYLDFDGNFTNTITAPTWHYEKGLTTGERIAMIHMPVTMFDHFITAVNGNKLELPVSGFIRQYDNLSDLYAQIEPPGLIRNMPGVPDNT
ncbi:MAG: hypothetical protein A4E35_01578 [Methanoregula sp. PtaU1.Bin051]|nr:MAG: hypothetical protein A4E35_01578 [Methanoregula sp. PtaU1.Bin051]